MIWDGKTVFTLLGYKPLTAISTDWTQVSDGGWKATDRGVAQDSFSANVIFRGPRTELVDLETALDDNRCEFTATFGQGEEVFGMDLDYSSSYLITVTEYGTIQQEQFDAWTLNLTIRLFTPVFLSVTGSLASLRLGSFLTVQNSEFDIKKYFSYTSNPFYTDRGTDPGIFEAEFTQTCLEMKAIRRYLLLTNRTSSFAFPAFPNVTTPFGSRMPTVASGQLFTWIIFWEDLGRANYTDWGIRIRFARDREIPE